MTKGFWSCGRGVDLGESDGDLPVIYVSINDKYVKQCSQCSQCICIGNTWSALMTVSASVYSSSLWINAWVVVYVSNFLSTRTAVLRGMIDLPWACRCTFVKAAPNNKMREE